LLDLDQAGDRLGMGDAKFAGILGDLQLETIERQMHVREVRLDTVDAPQAGTCLGSQTIICPSLPLPTPFPATTRTPRGDRLRQ
jgi:hypothetical protein